jgi:hypothetical protein
VQLTFALPELVRPTIRKEEAPCCRARALPDGRPVIGWCSEVCVRRPRLVVPVPPPS